METQIIQVKKNQGEGKITSEKEKPNIDQDNKEEKIKLFFGDEEKRKLYHKNFKNNRISTTKYIFI